MHHIVKIWQAASIPLTYRTMANNVQLAVLDRRAWLHNNVFSIRSDPDEEHKVSLSLCCSAFFHHNSMSDHHADMQFWNKAVAIFRLVDPATNLPFPLPIPRSAFPMRADPHLLSILKNWAITTASAIRIQRSTETINQVYSNTTRPSMNYLTTPSAAYPGGGAGGMAGAGLSGGGSGLDHATIMDTVNMAGILANTILGVLGGGDGFSFSN